MKRINNKEFQDSGSSGLITWSGQCINCLGIKTGDNLNVVVNTIAEKVCELASPLDLTDLTLECAIDLFSNAEETGTRTLSKVLQLLIDNECSLKELIDVLQESIDNLPTNSVTLNLKCLGDSGVYTNQAAFQLIINDVCALRDEVTELTGRVTTLQNQVDNLDIPTGDENIVTTCISGPKAVSAALEDVANDYCSYKDILGSTSQIQTAIAKQVSVFNTLMSGVAGWVTAPTSEAQSIGNLWLLMANYLPRIIANETCCSTTCDDVKIGFSTSIDGDSVILSFGSGAGTFIPLGYTDCGSILNITDTLGNTVSVFVTISQNGDSDPIDLSAFTVGSVLSFNIDVKMCSETQTCNQCVNKDVKYINDGCCVLTNSSSESLTITYTTPSSLT